MTNVSHKLFVQTAREMAAATYETMAQNNEFYAACKSGNLSQDEFVDLVYVNFLNEAKKTLTNMLTLPSTPEWMKEQIYDACVEDNIAKQTVNRHERRAMRSANKASSVMNGRFN